MCTRETAEATYLASKDVLVGRGWTPAQVAAKFKEAREVAEKYKGSALDLDEINSLAASLAKIETPPPAANTTPADGKTVSEVAKARIESVNASLGQTGFTSSRGEMKGIGLSKTKFDTGTRVVEGGEERYRSIHAEVTALPRLVSFVGDVGAQVKREVRQDHTVQLGQLRVTEGAGLATDTVGEVMWPTKTSLGQLGKTLGFSDGVSYLWDTASPHVRATALADHLRLTCSEKTKRGTKAADNVVLRTLRRPGGSRVIYGQVSEKYTPVDTDVVLGCVLEALGPDVNVEGKYSEGKGKLTAIYMADHVVDLACGDVFKSAVDISWDDRGTGSIIVRGAVWRNLCLNLIIVDKATIEIASLVHKGSREAIVAEVKDAVARALEAIGPVLEAYGIARQTKLEPVTIEATDLLPERTMSGVESLLTTWATDGTLGLPRRSQADRDRAVAALLGAWAHEPGETLADAINAVTRAAHSEDWMAGNFREEMERIASTLLPIPVGKAAA